MGTSRHTVTSSPAKVPRPGTPRAAIARPRAAARARSEAPASDQVLSDADQSASAADQINADRDQRSSDRDQAAADRDHDTLPPATAAGERAYGASRKDRVLATDERHASQAGRAATTRGREVTGRFRAVLEAGPNGVVATDADGTILYANEHLARMFGFDAADLVGEPIERLMPPSVGPRHVAHRERFMNQPTRRGLGRAVGLIGRRRDGSDFPIDVSLSPISTSDGFQVFATVVDITAQRAAQNRQLHAEKLESVGRLAAGIAHDFNNMLFAIQGYASLLGDDFGPAGRDNVDLDASLVRIHAISLAAERASNLTAQLLAFSRNHVVSPIVLDIAASVRAIEPLMRQLIGMDVELEIALDQAPALILADPGWIDQIVLNLVVNARDAMPDGGTARIESGRLDVAAEEVLADVEVARGSYVFVTVSDTGVGFDQATRERIFEPYFTTKELGKGTGLGLATTYGIVSQAGGYVLVTSDPGHGSSFKLLFPRAMSAAAPRSVRARPGAADQSARSGPGRDRGSRRPPPSRSSSHVSRRSESGSR